MIPGANLLSMAFGLIAQQALVYRRYVGRSSTTDGLLVTSYADPVDVRGSIQPIPKTKYEALGLDLQRSHVTIFVSLAAAEVDRETAGDVFDYAGRRYQCLTGTDWYAQDGWREITCVDQGTAP